MPVRQQQRLAACASRRVNQAGANTQGSRAANGQKLSIHNMLSCMFSHTSAPHSTHSTHSKPPHLLAIKLGLQRYPCIQCQARQHRFAHHLGIQCRQRALHLSSSANGVGWRDAAGVRPRSW